MPFTTPTVSDFKAQFPRDFPYAVPAWGAAGVATVDPLTGAILAIAVTAKGQGYMEAPTVSLKDGSGSGFTGTVTIIKGGKVSAVAVNASGANYGQTPAIIFTGGAGDDTQRNQVQDSDIEGAFLDAGYNVGQGLFADQATYGRAFGYLSAHSLVEKLLMGGEGMFSQYNWLTASKHVGAIGEAFVIPDRIKKDPWLAGVSKTRYGAAYLQIVLPLMIGNMQVDRRCAYPT